MKSAISEGSYVPSSQPDRRLATLSEELGKVGVNIEGFCATVAGAKGVRAPRLGARRRTGRHSTAGCRLRARAVGLPGAIPDMVPTRAINFRVELVTKRWHA
jgi:hypothetical protein